MDTAYAGGAGGKQDLTCSRLASKLHRRLEGEMLALEMSGCPLQAEALCRRPVQARFHLPQGGGEVSRAGKAPPAEFYSYLDFLTGAFAADTTTEVFLLSPE